MALDANLAVDAPEDTSDTSAPIALPHADRIAVCTHPVSGDLSVTTADAFTWTALEAAGG